MECAKTTIDNFIEEIVSSVVAVVRLLWNVALDTALRGGFSFIGCVCVYVFFHLYFVWQTTSFHAYCFYAFVLLNAILLIREFLVYIIIGEEYKTLLFDLFRLLLLLLRRRRRRHRRRRFLHVYFIIRFFSSKVTNNKGKCHFAMLSRMTVIYGQVMRNQSGSLNFANGQIQKQTAYEKKAMALISDFCTLNGSISHFIDG